eukprot:5025745-Prymnesium_polylepis.1
MCAACFDCSSSWRHFGIAVAGRTRVADALRLPRRPALRKPCSMSTWDEGHPQKTTCECLAVGLRLCG